MNSSFKKALCISTVCVLLASNVSFADTNYETKKKELSKLEKKVKIFEKSVCNNKEQYIKNLNEITNINLFLNNPQAATDTLTKQEKFIIQNEGNHSVQLVPIFLKKAEIYSFSNIDTTIVNDNLKKAEEIINKNPTNTDIKIEYLYTLIRIAREKDEHYKALSLIKELEKIKNIDNMTKTYTQIELSETYGILKDFKNAKKALNVAYNLALIEYKKGNKYVLYDYYVALINFHKYKLEYTNAINAYNKLDSLLAKDKDVTVYSKLAAAFSLAAVEKEFKHYNNFKKIIDENKKLTLNNNDHKYQLYNMLADYYFDIGEFEEYKNILDKQKKFHNEYTSNHLIRDLYRQERIANYYENTGKINKAISFVQEDLERIEKIKDEYPGVYGYKLKELSDLYKENNDTIKAIETYKEALTYTERIYPNNSYRRIEELKEMAELYKKQNNYANAYIYADNARKIIEKINVEKTEAALDVYNCIFEIYFDKRDIEKATLTIEKIIKISEEIYGNDHIKTMDKKIKKIYLYSITKNIEEENKLIKEIQNTKISGIDYNFWKDFNKHLATKYLNDNNEIALDYAFKAKSMAKKASQKNEINRLISEIYKQQGKKFKSLKYKLK